MVSTYFQPLRSPRFLIEIIEIIYSKRILSFSPKQKLSIITYYGFFFLTKN